jgi:hypothetical protein
LIILVRMTSIFAIVAVVISSFDYLI